MVKDTPNTLLEEEVNGTVKADRYEKLAEREAYRARHYERGLITNSSQAMIEMHLIRVFM